MTPGDTVEIPNLEYGGTALFLLGMSYRLMRWVIGTIEDDDAPPGTVIDTSSALPNGRPLIAKGLASVVGSASPGRSTDHAPTPFDSAVTERTSASPWVATDPEAPPGPGDPNLFPESMLEAMSPAQHAHVESSLMQQRTARSRR
jgi:hypothetical protein